MTGAILRRLVLALGALAALGASGGLAVPQHRELPGTPLYHDHVLGAYRFAFLLPDPAPTIAPAMARLHQTLVAAGVPMDVIAQMPGMLEQRSPSALPTIATAGQSPIQDLAVELALLLVLAPRLARPTLRAVAELRPRRALSSLWRLAPTPPPPRSVVLP